MKFLAILLALALPAFTADYSPTNQGTHVTLSWDPGCEFNILGRTNPPGHGTELWAAWVPEGFNVGPTWSNLLAGVATNRFRMAEIPGTNNTVQVALHPGTYFLTVYSYIDQEPHSTTNVCYDEFGQPSTNITEFPPFRSRSEPANVLRLDVPSPVRNVALLSTTNLAGPLTLTETFEVDITGSAEKYFTLTLVPMRLPPPPPPPLPGT